MRKLVLLNGGNGRVTVSDSAGAGHGHFGTLLKCVKQENGMGNGERVLVVQWPGYHTVESGGERAWHNRRVVVYKGWCTGLIGGVNDKEMTTWEVFDVADVVGGGEVATSVRHFSGECKRALHEYTGVRGSAHDPLT